MLATSLLLLSGVSADGSFLADVLPGTSLVSFGIVLPLTAASVATTSGFEDSKQGLASGLLSTTQQVGAALGLAILVAVSTARTEVLAGAGVSEAEALAGGLRYAFAGGAGFALAGALISVFLLREGKRK